MTHSLSCILSPSIQSHSSAFNAFFLPSLDSALSSNKSTYCQWVLSVQKFAHQKCAQWMIFYALVANLWARFLFLFYICVCISPTSSPVSIGYTVMCIKIVNMWEHFFSKCCAGLFSFSVYMLVDWSNRTRKPNLSLNLKLNRSLQAKAETGTETEVDFGVVMSYSFRIWFMQRTLSK